MEPSAVDRRADEPGKVPVGSDPVHPGLLRFFAEMLGVRVWPRQFGAEFLQPVDSLRSHGRTAVGSGTSVTPNCSCTASITRPAKVSSSAAVAPGSVVSARLWRDDVPTLPCRVPRPKPACWTSQAALSLT